MSTPFTKTQMAAIRRARKKWRQSLSLFGIATLALTTPYIDDTIGGDWKIGGFISVLLSIWISVIGLSRERPGIIRNVYERGTAEQKKSLGTFMIKGRDTGSLMYWLGAVSILVALVVTGWHFERRPNQRPEANAGNAPVATSTLVPGVAHP